MTASPPLFSAPVLTSDAEHPLFTVTNVYRAYLHCRKHKRSTCNALRFEYDLEGNILALSRELAARSYQPGASVGFLLDKPKKREIFAASFRDRVVHHVLVRWLEPAWERRFIHDSYACRKGKGTHKAVERLQSFTRRVSANRTRPAWYLQLDIKGFFNSIDKNILFANLCARETDPALRWLVQLVLYNDPVQGCRLKASTSAEHLSLPAHKTLFRAKPDCGLPIGNLTSQFFANVFLDPLDQFVKHTLRAPYYIRYCDDFVLLASERETLVAWEARILDFLWSSLRLTCNARRKLRPVADGIDFLGYIVRPDYLLIRRRVVAALRERLAMAEAVLLDCGLPPAQAQDGSNRTYPWPTPLLEEIHQWLCSYQGHTGKGCDYRLWERIRVRFVWLEEYFLFTDGKAELRCPRPRPFLRFLDQARWFSRRLPGHALLLQTGAWWRFFAPQHSGFPFAKIAHFPAARLPAMEQRLKSLYPAIGWIKETGRIVAGLAERVLEQRWTSTVERWPGTPLLVLGGGQETTMARTEVSLGSAVDVRNAREASHNGQSGSALDVRTARRLANGQSGSALDVRRARRLANGQSGSALASPGNAERLLGYGVGDGDEVGQSLKMSAKMSSYIAQAPTKKQKQRKEPCRLEPLASLRAVRASRAERRGSYAATAAAQRSRVRREREQSATYDRRSQVGCQPKHFIDVAKHSKRP